MDHSVNGAELVSVAESDPSQNRLSALVQGQETALAEQASSTP